MILKDVMKKASILLLPIEYNVLYNCFMRKTAVSGKILHLKENHVFRRCHQESMHILLPVKIFCKIMLWRNATLTAVSGQNKFSLVAYRQKIELFSQQCMFVNLMLSLCPLYVHRCCCYEELSVGIHTWQIFV